MSPLRIFACLAAAAHGLNIRGDAPAVATSLTCPLDLPVSNLALASDETLETTGDKVVDSPQDKQKVLQEALSDYKVKKQAYKLATAKLMAAMEALLAVPSADTAMLEKVATGKSGKDSLVVFYAPWCPHCQTFVLHDQQGNPANAPLEVLRKDLAKAEKTKDLDVIRADVTVVGKTIPKDFAVQAIPTVYFVNKQGKEIQFNGNPHSEEALKAFINEHVGK